MQNLLNLRQDVTDYIETLTNEQQVETAMHFATNNTDCDAEAVKQAVELANG